MIRSSNTLRTLSVPCALFLALAAPAARAADVTATVPAVTAPPGATVSFPITISPNLVGLNVEAIQLQVPLTSAIASASWLPSGLVQSWGAPFTNVTSTFAALATFGVTPITSSSMDLATLQVHIAPGATVPSDVPMTLSLFRLNGTTPTTAVVAGVLHIRSSVGVDDTRGAAFALDPPSPSPVRTAATIAFALPANAGGAPARVAIFGVDGRRVRLLADGVEGAGRHEVRWNADDDRGTRVRAGVYFLRLDWAGQSLTRRIPVTP